MCCTDMGSEVSGRCIVQTWGQRLVVGVLYRHGVRGEW